LFGYSAKPHTEQKPTATVDSSKVSRQDNYKAVDVCYYCKAPGHIMPSCHKLRAKREQKEAPVHLVSTLPS